MTPEIIEHHRTLPGGHGPWEVSMWNDNVGPRFQSRHMGQIKDMADWRRMIDGYDCGIRYMDGHIGQILDRLEAAGVLDDTAIMVSSDHGEDLGELNCYGEHGLSDYITHRIPMIIRWPGMKQGTVDSGFHYNLDLAPTIADLLGVQKYGGWQGKSYAPALTDGEECGHDHLVLGQSCHGAMRSVRFGDYIYIRTIHGFYHMYPREMLFNVVDDPHETHDLAEERPDLCAEGARLLLTWQEDRMYEMPDAIDPIWTVMREGGPFHSKGHLPAYCERLEATGRGQFVEELKKRHPSEFK